MELARIGLDGFATGMLAARDGAARLSRLAGNQDEAREIAGANGGDVVISASAQKRIIDRARVNSGAWVNEIETRCRRVLVNVDHSVEYDAQETRRQLGAVLRAYIEIPEPLTFAEATPKKRKRGRRAKVRNKEQYKKFQESRLPYLKYVRNQLVPETIARARERVADKNLPPSERSRARKVIERYRLGDTGDAIINENLKAHHLKQKVITDWNEEMNRGVVEQARNTPAITHLQWTTARDNKVCAICQPYDGLVVTLKSSLIGNYSPPLHPNCRCMWIPLTRAIVKEQGLKATKRRKAPADPVPGYGGIGATRSR